MTLFLCSLYTVFGFSLRSFSDASVCHVTNVIGGGGALTVIVALDAHVGGGVTHRRGSYRRARRVRRALHAAVRVGVADGGVGQGRALGRFGALCKE